MIFFRHSVFLIQRLQAKVIQDEQVSLFDIFNLFVVGLIGLGHTQSGEELLQVVIKGSMSFQAPLMSQGTGQEAFFYPGKAL